MELQSNCSNRWIYFYNLSLLIDHGKGYLESIFLAEPALFRRVKIFSYDCLHFSLWFVDKKFPLVERVDGHNHECDYGEHSAR